MIKLIIFFEKCTVKSYRNFKLAYTLKLSLNKYIVINFIKILKECGILLHYDSSAVKFDSVLKIYNIFKLINRRQDYIVYDNIRLQDKNLFINAGSSSTVIFRELSDMFNINTSLYDSRKILLDYTTKKGVLIY